MAIKCVIFDVGQVCYPYSLEPLNVYLRNNTLNPSKFDQLGGAKVYDYKPLMLGQVSFEQFCQDICKFFEVAYSPQRIRQIDVAMHQGVGDFFPETLRLISELRAKNISIALLSNALPNLEDTALNLVDEDKVFVSYQLKLLKPNPEIYRQVLKQLNLLPHEVIFVDDKLKNVEAARKIGITSIVFTPESIMSEMHNYLP